MLEKRMKITYALQFDAVVHPDNCILACNRLIAKGLVHKRDEMDAFRKKKWDHQRNLVS